MSVDDLLQRASSSAFETYDPRAVIDAVNALVPLGKDGALAAITNCLAKNPADPHRGLFLVLRVAFDADPHPPLRLGAPSLAPPADPAALPRFPIAIVDDAPLLLVSRYTLRGLSEPLSAHVDHYRAHGSLRSKPLAPAAGADRLASFDAAYRAAYHAAPSDDELSFIQAQLTRAAL